MEFIKVYAMTAIPVFFAFAAIWWFMTISIIHHPPAKAARAYDARANDARADLVESKLLEAIAPPEEWRKAA